MRAPLEWLREYCASPLDAHALADRLTMTGTKVEAVERHGVTALENFVTARVLEASPHPDAERLSVCLVDAGDGGPRQIVCGAPNVAAGQTVAVAKPGAVMPDGTTLGKAKLRGIESDGMILAEDELAIGTEHAGILVLDPDGIQPGTPLERVIPISTDVLVLEVTPNRPDCLGVYGVAREAHAATRAPLSTPPWAEDPGTAGEVQDVAISVQCPELCPRFTARVFDGVRIKHSPPWLKARLMAAGQRPISNVVDITNYVMLLTGQPLHAFDLEQVAGGRLNVRTARAGEEVTTLDGQQRQLDEEMVLIEDAQGPTSIAGLMGGARSEVSASTTKVLMEVANWVGPNIHRTSLKLGLRSEASSRFEKQLQPEQAMEAQAVATKLMIELCDARVRPGTIDVGGPGRRPSPIKLREARIESLLGAPIARERCKEILEALEFETGDTPDGLAVTPPAFRRADVTREADLIEEVSRLDGLEKLPATLPSRHGASGRLAPRQRLRRRAADALAAQGLSEIVGWSFAGPDLVQKLRLEQTEAVALENPLSSDQSLMRTTLLGSLLEAAGHNHAHGATAVALFETGPVFFPAGDHVLPKEPFHLGALLTGPVRPPTWREHRPPNADFFACKGVLQGVMEALRAPWSVAAAARPFLHPGRSANIFLEGSVAGWIGEVHPLVAAEWDLQEVVAAFELDLDTVPEPPVGAYEDVTSFPAVHEDLAVIVEERITAAQLLAVVRRAAGPLLAAVEVFDVYRDQERIGEGRVSLALRLTYRAPDRTLTDEEVAERREAIVTAARDELNARVRVS